MTSWNDDEQDPILDEGDAHNLSRLFSQLRDSDAARVPTFHVLLNRTRLSGRRPRRHRRGYLVGTSVLAAAAVICAVWLGSGGEETVTSPAPTIAEWRPQSDVFLMSARQMLLMEIPPLKASVLDTILP
jgi:hypothetical protein